MMHSKLGADFVNLLIHISFNSYLKIEAILWGKSFYRSMKQCIILEKITFEEFKWLGSFGDDIHAFLAGAAGAPQLSDNNRERYKRSSVNLK